MSTTELGAELLPPGSPIGAWRVVSCAGRGMFGTVYRVQRGEPEDPRLYALKLASYPNDPRFEREVELLRRIEHPSVPRLHEAGVWKSGSGEPRAYFVMDLVEGVPLYGWAAGRRVSSRCLGPARPQSPGPCFQSSTAVRLLLLSTPPKQSR